MRRLTPMVVAVIALAGVPAAVYAADAGHGQHAAGPTGSHGTAGTAATEVAQLFAAFAPANVDVVKGDMVRWTNDSVRPHTVTADDESWDSGRMVSGQVYARHFDVAGVVPYHCVLHAGMRGEVRVHDVLLDRPAATAAPGRAFPLTGRTALPAGSPVEIEADTGAGFARVASTTVGAGGAFTASVMPRTTGSYRAVAGDRTSEAVRLLVLDRKVTARTSRKGRRLIVDVHVSPAAPGADVVLQLYLKHRFGWWPVRHVVLDRRSRARITVPLRAAPPARVVLTLPDGATALASSGPLKTR